MKRKKKGSKLGNYAVYLAARALGVFINALPERAAVALGRGIGRFIHAIGGKRISRAEDQLRLAFGEQYTPADRRRIALDSYRHLGLTVVETLRLPKITADNWDRYLDRASIEAFVQEMGDTGVIVVASHIGAYHAGAHVSSLARPLGMSSLERPVDNPHLAAWITRLRGSGRMGLISKFDSFLEVRKALNKKQAVALLIDQDGGKRGVFVDFLGTLASTWTSAAEMQELMKLPIIVASAPRDGLRGLRAKLATHGRIEWKPLPEGLDKEGKRAERERRILETTAEVNRMIGEDVRRWPEQWMWMHRRWKTRPPGDPTPVVNGVPCPWLLKGGAEGDGPGLQ